MAGQIESRHDIIGGRGPLQVEGASVESIDDGREAEGAKHEIGTGWRASCRIKDLTVREMDFAVRVSEIVRAELLHTGPKCDIGQVGLGEVIDKHAPAIF